MALIIKNIDKSLDRKALSAVHGGYGQGSQPNMIRVQSLVSDRQRDSQRGSNVMHAIDDGIMQVIGNIK
jgi:hypothetical protein